MTNYTHNMPENITAIEDIIVYANTITGDIFGMFMLIVVFMIAFISLKDYRTPESFAAASFITTTTAVFFFIIGILAEWVVLSTILLLVVSVFLLSRK